MGQIRFRKTVTLPNGMKMNINKNSVSFTAVDESGNSVTINPKHKTKTTNIKLGNGFSYVDQTSTKKSKKKAKEEDDGEITI